MTRVLVHCLVGGCPRILASPRPRPRVRVLDGERVQQRVGVEPREPLSNPEVVARSAEPRLIREVGGLYHESVALPMADRVAQPTTYVRRQVFAADTDDVRVMDHLSQDHHFRWRLNDL